MKGRRQKDVKKKRDQIESTYWTDNDNTYKTINWLLEKMGMQNTSQRNEWLKRDCLKRKVMRYVGFTL